MKHRTKSTPNFGEASKRFRDAGMDARWLLPIAPVDAKISANGLLEEKSLGKAPGRYNSKHDDWTGLGGVAVKDGLSSWDLKSAVSWPTPNVGICGAYLPGIDCDAASPEFRRLVEDALDEAFGPKACYGTRIRGDNDRRLYAFRGPGLDSEDRVKTVFLKIRLPSDAPEAPPHGLDIIGFGNQYVAAGVHPSGDLYDWEGEWHVATLFEDGILERVTNTDIERFLEIFAEKVEEAGGQIIRGSHANKGVAEERDHSSEPPVMPVDAILDGLNRLPNSDRDRFPMRDDFVQAVAAIRAALGGEAEAHEDDVRDWACADPEWCPPEYFDKVWNSLSRGQRVSRRALDMLFKRNKIYVSAKYEFPDDLEEHVKDIRELKNARKDRKTRLLDEVTIWFVFGNVNTREDNGEIQMRSVWDAGRQWSALKWWRLKSQDVAGKALLLELHEEYPADEVGFWDFIRDLGTVHPEAFFSGETRWPTAERGDIVEEENPDGSVTRYINMRYLSPVIRHAKKAPENKKQAREDVRHVLDFMGRMFPEARHLDYELDTLAYMVQTGKRPGHLLFLVGAPGVGKSIYTHMLISMFDGIGKDMGGQIDGAKLINEASRRFALARVEGCRIISVKELPDGKASTPANMAAVTATLKQIVDPGPDADFFQIEKKGIDSLTVRNFARVILTSNYKNAIQIEEHDRRIFYNQCGVTEENKPEPDYYVDLTDITGDPGRLAAFWRYLRDRDISHYKVALPPPVSAEKKAVQIAAIENPVKRHMVVAIGALRHAGRMVFDAAELYEIMTAMADNEHVNTQGAVDDRRDYAREKSNVPKPDVKKALSEYLSTVAEKASEPKFNGERSSTIYAFRDNDKEFQAELASAKPRQIMEMVVTDRDRYPLSQTHPIPLYSGPPRLKAARER